jgi:hypothetical protein
MFPKPPQLFRGKGVTDDPASETYWKAANGIRFPGMPSFKTRLTDTQLWQVSELLAHANEIPDSVIRQRQRRHLHRLHHQVKNRPNDARPERLTKS